MVVELSSALVSWQGWFHMFFLLWDRTSSRWDRKAGEKKEEKPFPNKTRHENKLLFPGRDQSQSILNSLDLPKPSSESEGNRKQKPNFFPECVRWVAMMMTCPFIKVDNGPLEFSVSAGVFGVPYAVGILTLWSFTKQKQTGQAENVFG